MGDGQTSGHGRRLVIEKLRQVLLGAIGELTLITEPTEEEMMDIKIIVRSLLRA